MQWIKTLIIFLALFLGGGASSAQPHTGTTAKNEPSSPKTTIQSLLNQTSLTLSVSSTQQVMVSHSDQKKKNGLRGKYRCGSKRFKNFHHANPMKMNLARIAHRHIKYCCGRFCCGKKSWQKHHAENKSSSPDPCWVDQFQDDQSPNNGAEFSLPPPIDNFMLLPEAVLIPYHKSLSIIAPRA